MLGSLLGDIIGSRFEFMSTQQRDVTLFHSACSWTDDSALTYAVAKVCEKIKKDNITHEAEIEELFFAEFKKIVKEFPMAGWGKSFYAFAMAKKYIPNNSAANGCLMRVAPIVLYFNDLETIQKIGQICTKVSHNHPESFLAVQAFLEILHYLKNTVQSTDVSISHSEQKTVENKLKNNINLSPDGNVVEKEILPFSIEADHIIERKEQVKKIASKYSINIDSVEKYHETAGYWAMAKDTLPRALAGFLEGNSFDSVMKNMLYIGSDTDTTATIAGSLAELTYSLDYKTIEQVYRYYDHKSFHFIQQICKAYLLEENRYFVARLFDDASVAKIKQIIEHKPVDPTAQWDPLEVPSDEEYYKLKPGFSFKKLIIKLFGREI